ncbi:alpha-tectorin-like [Diadema setosum]|uniref:alpha-tectorin-like n=1 Tax=Diadema setosum TaxID=31175 RepID=UPI003B3B7312
MLTPYWADVNTETGGTVSYREVEPSETHVYDMATKIVREAFVTQQVFQTEWMFITTWDHVGFYGSEDPSITNTFQCVLVAGGTFSAVFFNYETVKWTAGLINNGDPYTGLGGDDLAQIGFNGGDGRQYYAIPVSRSPEVVNVVETSNIGVPGRFVFGVDRPEIVDVQCKTSVMPIYRRPGVNKENQESWLSSTRVALTWDTEAFGPDLETVDVVVYEYYEDVPNNVVQWREDVVLARNISYVDGRLEFTKPYVDILSDTADLMGAIAVYETNRQV